MAWGDLAADVPGGGAKHSLTLLPLRSRLAVAERMACSASGQESTGAAGEHGR